MVDGVFTSEIQRQKLLFASADCVALMAAFGMAMALHDPSSSTEQRLASANPTVVLPCLVAIAGIWIVVFRAFDLYRMRNGGSRERTAVSKACTVAVLCTLLVLFLAHIHNLPRLTVLIAYLLSIPLVLTGRSVTRACLRRCYSNPRIAIPLVIVGFNTLGQNLLDELLDGPTHYEPIGFLDSGSAARAYRGFPILGSPEYLARLRAAWPALEAVIALPYSSQDQQEALLRLCEENRIRWWMVPWTLREFGTGLKLDQLGTVPVLGPRSSNLAGLNFVIKRSFDLSLTGLLLIVTAPVMLLAALAIWLSDGRPVFFRQVRIGMRGKPFELLKLRTMCRDAADTVHRNYVREWINGDVVSATTQDSSLSTSALFKLEDDPRITRIGRILRRFSIDELPQLINVWRGEMSLIGPRPALPYELDHYQDWHRRRFEAMPGITGLWQVSGRNALPFNQMVLFDLEYLRDWSFSGDLKILFRTVPTLLRGSGV